MKIDPDEAEGPRAPGQSSGHAPAPAVAEEFIPPAGDEGEDHAVAMVVSVRYEVEELWDSWSACFPSEANSFQVKYAEGGVPVLPTFL